MIRSKVSALRRQRGAAAIEFALVAAFGGFVVLLFGAIEVARVMYFMSSANEATEMGARIAVVCDADSALIKQRMQQVFPSLSPENISIEYYPGGCASDAETARAECDAVKVSIAPGMHIDTVIPFVDVEFDMPAFATIKTREALDSANCT